MLHKNEKIAHYVCIRVLSDRGQSPVYLVEDLKDGVSYACKVVDRSKIDQSILTHLEHEIRIHAFLRHENVVALKDVIYTDKYIAILTEYCSNGDLFEQIMKGYVKGRLFYEFFSQIAQGLDYIHSKGIAHLDLKPENVFIDSNYVAKIADFGCCEEVSHFSKCKDIMGTLYYIAPEMLKSDCADPRFCDIWSFGVIMYSTINGFLPWGNECSSDKEIIEMIKRCHIKFPQTMPSLLVGLIMKCLSLNPYNRPTSKELIQSSILCKYKPQRQLQKVSTADALFKNTRIFKQGASCLIKKSRRKSLQCI
ncbi:CAMK family protein kinase [Tritrichomonas foetus]|uniref:CAMK family protein kinase n=1 Tax=Tritrichomonas foetus TaxID=1144522 RepID=A0A1J4JN51_9EUKA|nr:CAMK family protein kinase [Tritrichomonas foetus]|eukprot:OHS98971.1 CAMK family protein kinase [Tritrichomonas foetus]